MARRYKVDDLDNDMWRYVDRMLGRGAPVQPTGVTPPNGVREATERFRQRRLMEGGMPRVPKLRGM